MGKMQMVIELDEEEYRQIVNDEWYMPLFVSQMIKNGTPLPKNHGYIAILDSEEPFTEDMISHIKDTTFIGSEECPYCFDITEIIKADKEES